MDALYNLAMQQAARSRLFIVARVLDLRFVKTLNPNKCSARAPKRDAQNLQTLQTSMEIEYFQCAIMSCYELKTLWYLEY